MSKKLKAGIVGLGRIASDFQNDPLRKSVVTHAAAYKAHPDIELVAACDIDQNRLKAFGQKWNVSGLYSDLGQMLARENLDILSICTWPKTHFAIAKQAILSGIKLIYCEKPVTDELVDAYELIDLCRQHNVKLAVNHQRRWDPLHQGIKEFIDSGKLGEIQTVSAYYTAGILNTGTHLLDLLRFFCGNVEWVTAAKNGKAVNEQDPNFDVFLKFEKGFYGHLSSLSVKAYVIFEIDIFGTAGRIRIANSGFDVEYWNVGESKYFSGYQQLIPAQHQLPTNDRQALLHAVEDLVQCAKTQRQPKSSVEDGLKALELIYAIKLSASTKESVQLPLTNRLVSIT